MTVRVCDKNRREDEMRQRRRDEEEPKSSKGIFDERRCWQAGDEDAGEGNVEAGGGIGEDESSDELCAE